MVYGVVRDSEAPFRGDASFDALVDLLRGTRFAVLTGAGCSTESGIPDYRGPETRRRARNPLLHRQFLMDEQARRRYWARAFVGWQRFADKRPNAAHVALATLEARGAVTGVVTQNVDGLHHQAGSRRVVELHGALREVICLHCGDTSRREALQDRLASLNATFTAPSAAMAPDGDADVDRVAGFRVAACLRCGGPLKPHVVFFGEGVPRPRVDAAWAIVREAEALLVVGSSLAVYSGYRFVRGASAEGRPVAIVNLGPTRGDRHAAVKVDARAGAVLPALVTALTSA